ncbi:MAG: OmpH family outer membrane protein [Pirellulales bacterium]|nr:OmpH family outer membrane protein [Pirellulales bacterium]
MKRSIILAIATTLILTVSGAAQAQGTRIALIDVGYIFKNHNGFKSMRQQLEQDVNLANVDFQTRRARLEEKQKTLLELKKGTTDYSTREAELAREAADMNAALVLERNKFSEREAAIYYQVYQEVREATAAYCQQNGIGAAMQFNGDKLATDNPGMVQAEVARRVVYYDAQLDITPAVLQMLHSRAGAASANAGTGVRRQ